jgi:hypothetical protein
VWWILALIVSRSAFVETLMEVSPKNREGAMARRKNAKETYQVASKNREGAMARRKNAKKTNHETTSRSFFAPWRLRGSA